MSTILFPPPDSIRLMADGVESFSNAGTAAWSVQQFQSDPLPAFTGTRARNADAAVQFYPGNPPHVRMRLTGYDKPGTNAAGGVIEYDLFLHAPKPAVLPTLASLTAMQTGFDLLIKPSPPADQECTINAVEVSCDFDIVNAVTMEDFSYGIAVGKFGQHAGTTVFGPSTQPAAWFQHATAAFGFAEPVMACANADGEAYAMLAENVWTPFDFDVLPRIKAAIAAGAQYGMDQNLANWQVASMVIGLHVFGHCQVVVEARGMQVVAP